VSKLNQLSEEYLSPQKTQKAAVFFYSKDLRQEIDLKYSFFLLFYSLSGLNMTYITIFYDFLYTVTNDKIKQNDDIYQIEDTKKNNNNHN
jgi:hypothetical protein